MKHTTKSRGAAGNSGKVRTTESGGSSKSQPKGKGGSKWLEYTALATVPLVLVLGNSMLVPILPDMERKLQISTFQASLIITLFSVAAGLIIPVSGYLSDRYSRKAVILPSLALYGIAGIGAGIAAVMHSYSFLIAARALQGIGAAGTSSIAMALVGDKYKDGEESEALGLIEASNGAGKVVSPIIGSLLALIVWYAPLFAFPVFCAGSFAAMLFLIKEPSKEGKEQALPIKQYVKDIGKLYREKGRWLIGAFISGSLGLFILFGVLFRLSDLLEKAPYNIDGVAKGGILAIPLLFLVITAYITGHKIKNNGPLMRVLMIVGLGVMSVALAAAAFFHKNIYFLIGFAALSSLGTGLLLPCLNTLITGSVDRQHRGMVTSLYSSLRFFGVAFGPPLFGWIAGKSDMLLYGIVSGLSVGALLIIVFLVHPPKQAGDA
ncbi:MFS transporter [Paenibacillus sacheonensis]|uniref:MFS transporter n=1 Tax=Paenibacillus sacheonensis TaxID=742054 RepID=A0A7X5C011_9BACL|nr:MFS transporter [Paenibacillus sacheonensis]MBM7563705.1 ACDE family multidrug resistance protein [Paenibacillus sacheonensis]NBC67939.1 MFS transporter [Paenibacillus sacheonensis]